MIDKKKLVAAIIKHLEDELMASKEAARATYEAATHDEAKPENQYDTRAIEASYLAGAQAKRAGEIDEVLALFQHMQFKPFAKDAAVSATALVEVESDGKRSLVFIMPKGGGFSLKYEGVNVQIVTPNSLLGEAILGLHAEDTADVEIGDKIKVYEILSVN